MVKAIRTMETFKFHEPGRLVDHELELVLAETFAGNPVRDFVPAYRFHMMLSGQNQKVGEIELRVGNTLHILLYAGHIGYGVDRAYRGRRLAARSVCLLLPLARSHGLHELWITCNPDNYASRRTCELAGFEFVEIVDLPPDTEMYQEGERQKCRYRRII
jgi:predicted acetyltransferase